MHGIEGDLLSTPDPTMRGNQRPSTDQPHRVETAEDGDRAMGIGCRHGVIVAVKPDQRQRTRRRQFDPSSFESVIGQPRNVDCSTAKRSALLAVSPRKCRHKSTDTALSVMHSTPPTTPLRGSAPGSCDGQTRPSLQRAPSRWADAPDKNEARTKSGSPTAETLASACVRDAPQSTPRQSLSCRK